MADEKETAIPCDLTDKSGRPCWRFQFRLRKLLLWTAVVALYLGVISRLEMEVLPVVLLTVYLTGLVVVRVALDVKTAREVAVQITGAVVGCWSVHIMGFNLRDLQQNWTDWIFWFYPTMYFMGGYMLGVAAGFVAFVIVYFVVGTVNWIDSLMRTILDRSDHCAVVSEEGD